MYKILSLSYSLLLIISASAAEAILNPAVPAAPRVAPASGEGELAIKRMQVAPGLKIDLWAAEPLLANPVTFVFDEKGRAYVCETFRLGAGVDDIRGIMSWLDEELASRSVNEREAEMKRHLGERYGKYSDFSERIRLVEDRTGTGKADHATVFAEGFNTPLDGLAAGILARKGEVWYANIPNLWHLRDTNHDGVADARQSLHYGFGVRVGFLGHDLHGPRFGPDGKLYFSVGDRGSNVRVGDGRTVGNPETGCVFRCYPDGSELEVFAYGLRNPQDLVFDEFGNLFTGDNNSDSGDQARWVYLVEGGDSGWRVGFQFMEKPYSRGPFNAERIWYPAFPGQAANIVPPIANLASGPSGVAYYPGTGFPSSYDRHFFLADFRGGALNSGVHTFTLDPKGAGFELVGAEHLVWSILATDVKFGVDGGLYVSDWVEGWGMTGKGRIYRVHASESDAEPVVAETKRLLAQDLDKQPMSSVAALLAHPDMRVRQEAQFALANGGATDLLAAAARTSTNRLARLHGLWGLGQIAARQGRASRTARAELDPVTACLADEDPEVRAQAAKVVGECRYSGAQAALGRLVSDAHSRVRFHAAMALGKLGNRESLPLLFELLRENADRDPYLRHAGVMGLTWMGDVDALVGASHDAARSVRLGALLALRRLQRPEIARWLHDSDPGIVLEAVRAIYDEPVNGAMPDLAGLLETDELARCVSSDVLLPRSATQNLTEAQTEQLGVEALLRRVLNANARLGTRQAALALAAFAARNETPPAMRAEALDVLGDWSHPSGRDRVVGLWRPMAGSRPAEVAAQALEPRVTEILHSAPDQVRIALLHAIGQLGMSESGATLHQLATNTLATGQVRAEALNTMAALNLADVEQVLEAARQDPSQELRRAAARLEGKLKSARSLPRLAGALETGRVGEQQTALAALALLPGEAVDDLLGDWLDRLRAGTAPKELELDILDAAGRRSTPRIRRKLDRLESSRPQDDPVGSFRETLFGGDPAEGKKVFFDKPEAQCVRCHRIAGEGGDVGPDLSHIGAQKERSYLLESIVLPNRQIAPGFESVTVTLKNGDSYIGVLKSETPTELVINSTDTGVLPVKKADIEDRRASLSPMPEGLGQILTKHELRDLIAFLSDLK